MTTVATHARRRVGGAPALLGALLALALAGCGTIPTSGPVFSGNAVAEGPRPVSLRASSPRQDASPQQIATGFLNAQTAGPTTPDPTGAFDVAREYLTPEAAADWAPSARVVVYQGDLGLDVDEAGVEAGATTARGTANVVGVVDEHGVYTERVPGTVTDVKFELVRGEDDQWRIDATNDGLIMSATNFERIYRPTSLYFPTPDRAYLVPDERWFPRRNWQTQAVRETLLGPSEWLAGSVTTVAPEGTALAIDSVPIDGTGTIRVPLNDLAAQASTEDRGLLAAQLNAVLSDNLPRTVQLTVDNAPLAVGSLPVLDRSVIAAADAVVLSGDRVMRLRGKSLEAIEDIAPLAGLSPTGLAFGDPRDDASPFVIRDSATSIVTAPTAQSGPATLLAGQNLLAPSVDRYDLVWTGPQLQGGSLQAVDVEGTAFPVAAQWLAGRTIQSIRVAPDGARIAVVSGGSGGTRVDVAGIVRDENGFPTQLSEPVRVGGPIVTATHVVWVDQTLLGVLGRSDGDEAPLLHLVPVGGPTRRTPPVEGAVSVAAGSGVGSILVGTDDGTLYAYGSAALWTKVTTEVRLPTYPG